MIQYIFFALMILTFLAGSFAYFSPLPHGFNPMKFLKDQSGYSNEESLNRKRTEEINISTNQGMIRVRQMMEETALEQSRLMDAISDEQVVVNNVNKGLANYLQEARKKGRMNDKDILRLQTLITRMQDEEQLMIARGRELIALNKQVVKNRQWLAQQIALADISSQNSLNTFQQRYADYNRQAAEFMEATSRYNQQVRDRMGDTKTDLDDLGNQTAFENRDHLKMLKEQVELLLNGEHEKISELADDTKRAENHRQEAQEGLANSKELLNQSLQRSQDLMEQEKERQAD